MAIDYDKWLFLEFNGNEARLPVISILDFDDIHVNSPKPIYVVVSGGIATGKTHIVRKHITQYQIMDIDDYMTKHGYKDYSRDGKEFQHAMQLINLDIQEVKKNKMSMVAMGTAANYDFLKFRLTEAREHGYETAVLQVKCPHTQALEQNLQRRLRGDHHVSDEEIHQIEETAKNSAIALDRLLKEDRHLLGYLCRYDNQR